MELSSCDITYRRGISGSIALSPSIDAVESDVLLFAGVLLEVVDDEPAGSAELLKRDIVWNRWV